MHSVCQKTRPHVPSGQQRHAWTLTRRDFIRTSLVLGWNIRGDKALGVQGYTAGRVTGLSQTLEDDGFYIYKRPSEKSGGHGVGWTELRQYSMKVPPGWEEIPVSIADPKGTEIDLRFMSDEEGLLEIVVAPVLRFLDVGYNADVQIEDIGNSDKLIEGFAPELFGAPLEDGDVLSSDTFSKQNITYYTWELKPHRLVTATAKGNRVYLLSITANSRQWRKSASKLRTIARSFEV